MKILRMMVLAIVLLIMSPPVAFTNEISYICWKYTFSISQDIQVGYVNVADPALLYRIKLKDIILSTDIPSKATTVICIINLMCPEGTSIVVTWWHSQNIVLKYKTKASIDYVGNAPAIYCNRIKGRPHGEWRVDVELPEGQSMSASFTIAEKPGKKENE
jgi:hypothetical protein